MSVNGTTNSTFPLSDVEIVFVSVGSGAALIIAITICVWWRFHHSRNTNETTQPSEKNPLIPLPPNPTPSTPTPPNPDPNLNPNPKPVGNQHVTLKVDKFMKHTGK
jgi:hypothetical protein